MSEQTTIGALLKRDNGVTYDVIGGATSINWSGLELSTIDSTGLNNANQHRTFKPGFIDPGSIDLTAKFDPNQATDANKHKLLKDDLTGRVEKNYRIVFPDGEYMQFAALVNKYGVDMGEDAMVNLNVSFKLTGQTNWGDTEP